MLIQSCIKHSCGLPWNLHQLFIFLLNTWQRFRSFSSFPHLLTCVCVFSYFYHLSELLELFISIALCYERSTPPPFSGHLGLFWEHTFFGCDIYFYLFWWIYQFMYDPFCWWRNPRFNEVIWEVHVSIGSIWFMESFIPSTEMTPRKVNNFI